MQQYDSSKPLISIHIPKCAGSSFGRILSDWFGEKLYLHYYDERTGTMPADYSGALSGGVCIHGHFNKTRRFGVDDYYPGLDQRITVLRDPFSMLVSRYFYQQGLEAKDKLYRDGEKISLSTGVNEFIEQQIHDQNYRPNILHFLPEGITQENYPDFLNSKFIYIGISEDMPVTVDRIAEKLGKPRVAVDRVNVSEKNAAVDERLRDLFRQKNELVCSIYDYVKANYLIW